MAPAREAKLERNPKWRLVISVGEKVRGSDEVGKIRGALSFSAEFSSGKVSSKNSSSDVSLCKITFCVALNDFRYLLNSLEIYLGSPSSPN